MLASSLLPTQIALHDVRDIEAFVAGRIYSSGLKLPPDEREELLLEGITISYELADRFEPHRPGYATAGRFSGYLAQFLSRRLSDAWHRSHPEHRTVRDADGKRRWQYDPPPVSLDALDQEGRDDPTE